MKAFLRQKVTGAYYGLDGEWVSDPLFAVSFRLMDEAVKAVQTERLHETIIVFRSDQAEYEISVMANRFLTRGS